MIRTQGRKWSVSNLYNIEINYADDRNKMTNKITDRRDGERKKKKKKSLKKDTDTRKGMKKSVDFFITSRSFMRTDRNKNDK